MEKLIPIQEHSDWLASQKGLLSPNAWHLHRKRVNFGKQPLEIWQFVPCKLLNGIWVVLEFPIKEKYYDEYHEFQEEHYYSDILEYQQAKERCLFEGFEIRDKGNFYFIEQEHSCIWYRVLKYNTKSTIENLLIFKAVKLTPTAQKQIGI